MRTESRDRRQSPHDRHGILQRPYHDARPRTPFDDRRDFWGALVGAALAVAIALDVGADPVQYGLIVLLAHAMGVQNAAARSLAVPDLTTTVLTLTITGLAADSTLAGGTNPRLGRRLLAVATMFLGAAVGALLVLQFSVSSAVALAFALLGLNAIGACWVRSRSEKMEPSQH